MWFVALLGVVVLFSFMAFTGAPYLPSKPKEVDRAFEEVYPLSPHDHLVDIGSGDGMVLRAASRKGARATGYEINPIINVIAKVLSRKDAQVTAKTVNFWKADFPSDTTVVYTFGDSRDIVKMAQKVQEQATKIGRPLAFISYAFEVAGREKVKSNGTHHLYLIKPLPQGQA